MKRFFLPLFLAATTCGAFAQQPDPFDLQVCNVLLLQAKEIQKEVGMTEAQRSRVQVFAEAFNKKKDTFLKAEKARRDKEGKNFQPNEAKLRGMFSDFRGQVLNQLSAKQIKRLCQVTLQEVGMASMLDSNVAKKLNITEAQMQKLRAAYKDGITRSAQVSKAAVAPIDQEFRNKDPKDPKMRDLFNQRMQAAEKKTLPELEKIKLSKRAKFRSILTAGQLAQWTALQGPPVKA